MSDEIYETEGNFIDSSENSTSADKGGKKPEKNKFWGRIIGAGFLIGGIAGGTMVGIEAIYNAATPGTSSPVISSGVQAGTAEAANVDSTSGATTTTVEDVAAATLPAMVIIKGTTTQTGFFGRGGYEATSSGTGIIIGKTDTELQILTNAHVISGASSLTSTFVNNKEVAASVKGVSEENDIAVIAVKLSDVDAETQSKIVVAPLSTNSDQVRVGQEVVAIGNALGEGQSVTVGYISAVNRSITVDNQTFDGLFLTDAAINSGNSGGALLNMNGQVIGINFAKAGSSAENMGYSIPVYKVNDLINELVAKPTRDKVDEKEAGFMGITGSSISADPSGNNAYPAGILVRSVQDDSPAAKAGIKTYDIITEFDGSKVASMTTLKNQLDYYKAGETVKIKYYSYDEKTEKYTAKEADITLAGRTA